MLWECGRYFKISRSRHLGEVWQVSGVRIPVDIAGEPMKLELTVCSLNEAEKKVHIRGGHCDAEPNLFRSGQSDWTFASVDYGWFGFRLVLRVKPDSF